MGEQPIFTTRAHVFQIDPVTKKNWLPSSKQAVNVSFFYDSTRSSFRIISVDGSKAIINSTIIPQMQFTKTSQKFGQWADSRANVVYGLGFGSEAELNKFIEQFDSVREDIKTASQQEVKSPGGSGGDANGTTNGTARASIISVADQSPVIKHTKERSGDSTMLGNVPISTSNDAQLRYENDRLKIALAQSSNNAKKWELELQTLKNNNARLTTALQESTSNVEEWKKQLNSYKEENDKLKLKIQDAPPTTSHPADGNENTRLQEVESKLKSMTLACQEKTKEAESLSSRIQRVSALEENDKTLQQKLKDSEDARAALQKSLDQLEERLSKEQSGRKQDSSQALQLHLQLGNLVQQLAGLHQDMAQIL